MEHADNHIALYLRPPVYYSYIPTLPTTSIIYSCTEIVTHKEQHKYIGRLLNCNRNFYKTQSIFITHCLH